MSSFSLPRSPAPAFSPRSFQQAHSTLAPPRINCSSIWSSFVFLRKKPLGLAIKGTDQAVPLLKTLQPPVSHKVLCDPASAPTTLPYVVRGGRSGKRSSSNLPCAPKSSQAGGGRLQTYWPSHCSSEAPADIPQALCTCCYPVPWVLHGLFSPFIQVSAPMTLLREAPQSS